MIMFISLFGPEHFSNFETHHLYCENPSSPRDTQKSISVEIDTHSEDQIKTYYDNLITFNIVSRTSAILNDFLPDIYMLGIWVPPKIS